MSTARIRLCWPGSTWLILPNRSLFISTANGISRDFKKIGSGRFITGIDPWELEAALEGNIGIENEEWWKNNVNLEDIYRGFIESVMALKLTFSCRWIRARSEHVACIWPDASIDWLHLDSNHSEIVSCRDVALWGPKMAQRATWIMDDTDWPSRTRLWRESNRSVLKPFTTTTRTKFFHEDETKTEIRKEVCSKAEGSNPRSTRAVEQLDVGDVAAKP